MADPSAAPGEICSSLCLLTYSMRRLIRAVSERQNDAPNSNLNIVSCRMASRDRNNGLPNDIQRSPTGNMAVVAGTIPQLLRAIDTIGQTASGRPLQQLAIYSIIQIFEALLKAICEIASAPAENSFPIPAKQKAATKKRQSDAPSSSPCETPTSNDTALELCRISLSMLALLQPPNPTHSEILDGFLFHLLHIVGDTLKHAVFDHADSPRALTNDDPHAAKATDESTTLARTPYLIWLLERALQTAARFPSSAVPPADESTTPSRTLPSQLSDTARLRLQHTLLKAVFGETGAGDFEPALQAPAVPLGVSSMLQGYSAGDEGGVKEKFKSELWRLLGWDVLRARTAWRVD